MSERVLRNGDQMFDDDGRRWTWDKGYWVSGLTKQEKIDFEATVERLKREHA